MIVLLAHHVHALRFANSILWHLLLYPTPISNTYIQTHSFTNSLKPQNLKTCQCSLFRRNRCQQWFIASAHTQLGNIQHIHVNAPDDNDLTPLPSQNVAKEVPNALSQRGGCQQRLITSEHVHKQHAHAHACGCSEARREIGHEVCQIGHGG